MKKKYIIVSSILVVSLLINGLVIYNSLFKSTSTKIVLKKNNSPIYKIISNNNKRNDIENKYGIKVYYGNELDYNPHDLVPNKLTDPNEVDTYISLLSDALSYYPEGFFKDFRDNNINLIIYLIKSVPNNTFAGLTKNVGNNVIITLTTTSIFNNTFHHEMMHYIDYYLGAKGYYDNLYQEWVKLNPSGYTYGSFIKEYNYNPLNKTNKVYFASNYGQTNYLEDRATIFKDMMSSFGKGYEDNDPINKKANLIAKQLETYFPSVASSNDRYWERTIKD